MRRALLAAVMAGAILFGAGPVYAQTAWRNATTNSGYEHILRDKIAAEHKRVCGRSLTSDSRLTWMARYRATDMVLNRYFAHQNPQGDRVWDGYDEAGIGWSLAAEIIAWNNAADPASADWAFKQFMYSSSHRAAIRSCRYRFFGAGSFQTVPNKKWFAVEFIVP